MSYSRSNTNNLLVQALGSRQAHYNREANTILYGSNSYYPKDNSSVLPPYNGADISSGINENIINANQPDFPLTTMTSTHSHNSPIMPPSEMVLGMHHMANAECLSYGVHSHELQMRRDLLAAKQTIHRLNEEKSRIRENYHVLQEQFASLAPSLSIDRQHNDPMPPAPLMVRSTETFKAERFYQMFHEKCRELESANKEYKKIMAERKHVHEEIQKQDAENLRLKKEVEELKTELRKVATGKSSTSADHSSDLSRHLIRYHEVACQTLDDRDDRDNKYKMKCLELEARLTDLANELRETHEKFQRLNSDRDKLRQLCDRMRQERTHADQNLAIHMKELTELRSHLAEYAQIKEKYDSLKKLHEISACPLPANKHSVQSMQLDLPSSELGLIEFHMGLPERGLIVRKPCPGSILSDGDEVISINNTNLIGLSATQLDSLLAEAVKSESSHLNLLRSLICGHFMQSRVVLLENGATISDLLTVGHEYSISHKENNLNSDPLLSPGDRIDSIGGVSVKEKSLTEVQTLLKENKEMVITRLRVTSLKQDFKHSASSLRESSSRNSGLASLSPTSPLSNSLIAQVMNNSSERIEFGPRSTSDQQGQHLVMMDIPGRNPDYPNTTFAEKSPERDCLLSNDESQAILALDSVLLQYAGGVSDTTETDSGGLANFLQTRHHRKEDFDTVAATLNRKSGGKRREQHRHRYDQNLDSLDSAAKYATVHGFHSRASEVPQFYDGFFSPPPPPPPPPPAPSSSVMLSPRPVAENSQRAELFEYYPNYMQHNVYKFTDSESLMCDPLRSQSTNPPLWPLQPSYLPPDLPKSEFSSERHTFNYVQSQKRTPLPSFYRTGHQQKTSHTWNRNSYPFNELPSNVFPPYSYLVQDMATPHSYSHPEPVGHMSRSYTASTSSTAPPLPPRTHSVQQSPIHQSHYLQRGSNSRPTRSYTDSAHSQNTQTMLEENIQCSEASLSSQDCDGVSRSEGMTSPLPDVAIVHTPRGPPIFYDVIARIPSNSEIVPKLYQDNASPARLSTTRHSLEEGKLSEANSENLSSSRSRLSESSEKGLADICENPFGLTNTRIGSISQNNSENTSTSALEELPHNEQGVIKSHSAGSLRSIPQEGPQKVPKVGKSRLIQLMLNGDATKPGVELMSNRRGDVFVRLVEPGSPASKAGLVEGDQLLTMDGQSPINLCKAQEVLISGLNKEGKRPSCISLKVQFNPLKWREVESESDSCEELWLDQFSVSGVVSPRVTSRAHLATTVSCTSPSSNQQRHPDTSTTTSLERSIVKESRASSAHPTGFTKTPTNSPRSSFLTHNSAAVLQEGHQTRISSSHAEVANVSDRDHHIRVAAGQNRLLEFHKDDSLQTWGITLVGGNVVGIFVKELSMHSACAHEGGLVSGDKVLECNEVSFINMIGEKAVKELNRHSHEIKLLVVHDSQKFAKVVAVPYGQDLFYVKALFSFNKSVNSLSPAGTSDDGKQINEENQIIGLNFDANKHLSIERGDLLLIDSTLPPPCDIGESDNFPSVMKSHCWHAWIINKSGTKLREGLVPSRDQLEILFSQGINQTGAVSQLTRPCHSRGGSSGSGGSSGGSSLRHDTVTRKLLRRLAGKYPPGNSSQTSSNGSGEFNSNSLIESSPQGYVYVKPISIDHPRPLILVGPLNEALCQYCQEKNPEVFRIPSFKVWPVGSNSAGGSVSSRLMGSVGRSTLNPFNLCDSDCLDIIRNGDYYQGVTLQSVRDVMLSSQHCLLTLSPMVIERLHQAKIYPILIFLRFKSAKQIKELRDPNYSTGKLSTKQAKEMLSHTEAMEQEYSCHISGIIPGSKYEQMYNQICNIVSGEQKSHVWISVDEC